MSVHRARAITLIAFAVAGLAGCGGDSEAGPPPTITVALPPPTVPSPAQPTAPPPAATTTTTTPKPAAKPRPQPVAVPIQCLRKAGLTRPRVRSQGIWGGRAGSGRSVLVDGPYESNADAKASADSLSPVSSAVAGGRYVASAPLRDKLDAKVRAVAGCLSEAS